MFGIKKNKIYFFVLIVFLTINIWIYLGIDIISFETKANWTSTNSNENSFHNINFTLADSSMTSAYEFKADIAFDFQFNRSYSSITFNLTLFEVERTESHMEISLRSGGSYNYQDYVAGVSGDGTGLVHDIEIYGFFLDSDIPHSSIGDPIIWRLVAYTIENEIIISTDKINSTAIIPGSIEEDDTHTDHTSTESASDLHSTTSGLTNLSWFPIFLSVPLMTYIYKRRRGL